MKNVDLLARWIGGHFYNCEFRPVPLCEYLVTDVKTPWYRLTKECNFVSHWGQDPPACNYTASKNGRASSEFCGRFDAGDDFRGKLGPHLLRKQNDDG